MRETDQKKIAKSKELLQELAKMRGGNVLSQHKRMANDPKLLKAFMEQYQCNNSPDDKIPEKYKQLMIMGMGAVRGMETTVKVHGQLAVQAGATAEEIGEVFRAVFMLTGVSGLFYVNGIFDELEE